MWILPSQLLKCAPDMEALDLESKTSLASDCEPLHIVSLRGSLKPISSVRWKKDSWMQHLYGAILKPFHTNRFTDWWTSSLRDTHVSHLAQQESEQVKKTQDIFGLGSQTEFDFFNQECASLKTSKDTSRWDSQQSSVIWKNWVIKVRSEYSVRVKLAQSTKGKECLSWPTATARDFAGKSGSGRQGRKGHPADTLPNAVAQWPTPTAGECLDQGTNWETLARLDKGGRILRRMASLEMSGHHAPVNHNTHGNRQGSWLTPNTMDSLPVRSEEALARQYQKNRFGRTTHSTLREQVALPPPSQMAWATPRSCSAMAATITEESVNKENRFPNLETQVGRQQWATPRAGKTTDENPETWLKRQANGDVATMPLTAQVKVKQWATPRIGGEEKAETRLARGREIGLHGQVGAMTNSAKLNSQWVTQLMGLNLGWVSPSCPASVILNWPKFVSGWCAATTEQMNCDCSAMELSRQQQPELF